MAWESLGKITVATAGTPVQIITTRTPCHAILVQQVPSQTGRIILGRSGMNSSTYASCLAILAIPTANIIPSAGAGIPAAPNGLNLADYWLDSTVNSEGALVSYLVL